MKNRKIFKIILILCFVLGILGFIGSLYNPRSEVEVQESTSEASSAITTTTIQTTSTSTRIRTVSPSELDEWLNSQKGCIKKNRFLTAHASDVPSVPEEIDWSIYSDTRFAPVTDTTNLGFFSDCLEVLMPYVVDAASDLGTALSQSDANRINSTQSLNGLPALPTYQAIKYLVETANANGSATLQSQYQFIAKRSFDYPFYNWSEVDYLVVYIDDNYNPFNNNYIFYEDVAVPANSFTLIRQIKTSGGSRQTVCIFPADQFEINNLSRGWLDFLVNPDTLDNLYCITQDGTQNFDTAGRGNFLVEVNNINYNTIRSDFLLNEWNNSESYFKLFMGEEERILNPFECLMGKFYNGDYSQPLMGSTNPEPWFLSCAFINGNDSINDGFKGTLSYSDENYTPRRAPSYIVDNDSPISAGSTLTVNNVNDFSDYGVSYNSDTNEFELDLDVLAGLIAGQIIPEFQGTVEAVFSAQPEIGSSYDTALNLNTIDTSIDIVNSLVPSSGGSSGGWVPPEYPPVNTSTYFPATVPDYSSYMAVTVGTDVIDSVNDYVSTGYDLLDTMGVAAFLIPLIIFGLLWWAIVGGD